MAIEKCLGVKILQHLPAVMIFIKSLLVSPLTEREFYNSCLTYFHTLSEATVFEDSKETAQMREGYAVAMLEGRVVTP